MQAINSPGWPIVRGVQTLKEIAVLTMRQEAAAVALSKLWADTLLTNAGIDSVNSLRYTYRGAANYDAIPNLHTVPALLNLNGADGAATFTNSGSGAHTFSATNGAVLDTAQKKFGTASLELVAASSQYISSADHADWNMDTNTTIEAFIRFTSKTTDRPIAAQHQDGNNYWAIRWETGNVIRFKVVNAGVIDINLTFAWNPSLATWYHFEFVKSGTDYYVFIDGTQIGTTGSDASAIPNFVSPLYIGFSYSDTLGGGCFWDGHIDDFRWTKNKARHTGNFTAPTSELTDDGGTTAVLKSVRCLNLTSAVTSLIPFFTVTLNTGAASYYVSTDDGTTWQAITTAQVGTLVGGLTSGTQIRLRVDLTLDAELEDWGVAA